MEITWMAEATRRQNEFKASGETHAHFAARVIVGFQRPELRHDPDRWFAEATQALEAWRQYFIEQDLRKAAEAAENTRNDRMIRKAYQAEFQRMMNG